MPVCKFAVQKCVFSCMVGRRGTCLAGQSACSLHCMERERDDGQEYVQLSSLAYRTNRMWRDRPERRQLGRVVKGRSTWMGRLAKCSSTWTW